MAQYISKDVVIAEIKTRIETYNKGYANGDDCRADALETFLHDIDSLEVKKVSDVWYDARKTLPEDGSEQIICIKEDGLAVSTIRKIVNGTMKWAYLGDLLNINSFNVEAKEMDLEKEIKKYIQGNICGYIVPGTEETAKYFFELGLKARKGE